jgi:hypothetical protein
VPRLNCSVHFNLFGTAAQEYCTVLPGGVSASLGNRETDGVRQANSSRSKCVSDIDSFIEEVSEEVRRDRLFQLMKKYGWIGIALVLLLVGGAAYNEWQKASKRTVAENLGDQLLAALKNDDSADRITALNEVSVDGDVVAMLALLKSAEALSSDLPDESLSVLRSVASDASVPVVVASVSARSTCSVSALSVDISGVPAAKSINSLRSKTSKYKATITNTAVMIEKIRIQTSYCLFALGGYRSGPHRVTLGQSQPVNPKCPD